MRVIAIWMLAICFSGCFKDPVTNCSDTTETYDLYSGKQILDTFRVYQGDTTDLKFIGNGNDLLFTYTLYGAQCDEVIDDEWGRQLNFTIPANAASFNFSGNQITQADCFSVETGAWTMGIQHLIDSGSISGQRLTENSWRVSVDVVLDTAHSTMSKIKFENKIFIQH